MRKAEIKSGELGLMVLKGVHKNYSLAEGQRELTVLKGIDLEIQSGESLAIIGRSGSGKSTLLNIMGTLDKPSSGKVLYRGDDVSGLKEKALAEFRNRNIGFIFQSHHLLPQCSVLENVLVPTLAFEKEAPSDRFERATSLLEKVGLKDRIHHRPSQLSGGESQRVAVVRALINGPGILLADEPTGSLDNASSEELMHLLQTLNREETIAMVMVTHSLELAGRMGRVLSLIDGDLQAAEKRTL